MRKQKIEENLEAISGVVNKFQSYHEQMLLQHEKLAGLQIEEGKLHEHTLLNLNDLNDHNLKVAKLLDRLRKFADKEYKVEMSQYKELEENLEACEFTLCADSAPSLDGVPRYLAIAVSENYGNISSVGAEVQYLRRRISGSKRLLYDLLHPR